MRRIKTEDTYRKLENMLVKTGFRVAGRKGTNNIYAHKSIDSIIVLPDKNKLEAVRGTYVTAIKRALVDNGLMETDEFEKELNAPTVRLTGHSYRTAWARAARQRASKDAAQLIVHGNVQGVLRATSLTKKTK